MINLSFWNICIFGGGAALLSAFLLHLRYNQKRTQIQRDMDRLKNETRALQKASEEKAQRDATARKTLLQIQLNNESEENTSIVEKRETALKNRLERQAQRLQRSREDQQVIQGRETNLKSQQAQLENLVQQAVAAEAKELALLEERSGALQKALLKECVQERKDEAKWRAKRFLTKSRDEQEQNATFNARQLMGRMMERISVSGHLERIQNIIPFPNPKTKIIFADPESDARKILHEHIDFTLEEGKLENSLLVRGDDPLGREIGRRVLRQLSNKSISASNKVRTICKRTNEEIDRELKNAARKAFKELGLKEAHPDIMALVGRLKFRLSYSQNQLKHAVEVAYLSGMLAQEMGLDVQLARRAGLLHDIGKAMTHEREGSHAVLGAEVARRCRENEWVSNAIGSHHNDEPMETPYAFIVTAADAISGARPGARRETITLYLDRVRQIQDIASRHPEVERVDVMHAGREVRIMVPGREENPESGNKNTKMRYVPDEELHPLAEDVARDLEDEMVFPGQIRVTVIRHSCAVAVAK
ncbi:MAG: HDIG domain-containing protein [Deltaproteobacteria bacterium]|nr:HDIG domain-containing protein [Deltaproteobacteria bacterium]